MAESVRARLLNIAKEEASDFQSVLVRFSLERLLYRLGVSNQANQFLLKGAMLFALWYDIPHRPTRDMDLLAFGDSDLLNMKEIFKEIAKTRCNDGIIFDTEKIAVNRIRETSGYSGARVTMPSELAKARTKVQIDIGFGDTVTPGPIQSTYPTLIADFPAPQLRTYPIYTVIAEKLHAISILGLANSRLKDYFDLVTILDQEKINNDILVAAISATFLRRGTSVSTTLIGLTNEFANDESRQAIWKAFLSRNQLQKQALPEITKILRSRLEPILERAAELAS